MTEEDAQAFEAKYARYIEDERPLEVRLRPTLDALPRVRVRAYDATRDVSASRGKFKQGDCHRNCTKAIDLDRSLTLVIGWTVSKHLYLSHSVVRMPNGAYQCKTPDHHDNLGFDGCYEFAPDPAFFYVPREWMYYGPERTRINTDEWSIVRRDTERVAAAYRQLAADIRAGRITLAEAEAARL